MRISANNATRVVIVDDSRTIQAMLESILESCSGFKVVGVASDAQSAATMVGALHPDLVTIDLCMPYIDGAALLEMLADHQDVCKVVISDHAASSVAMITRLRNAGAAACIAKTEMSKDATVFGRKLKAVAATFRTSRGFVRPLPSHEADAIEPTARLGARASPAFGYPIPSDERDRLNYLRRKQLANAVPDRQFDLVTHYFAQLTTFPVCLITFIDRDTQWLKSAYGFAGSSTPRAEAFCNYTIAQDSTFVVRNAANDPAFADNPLVTGDAHIRTYAGHPIVTEDGTHVGALCVIDTQVRFVSDKLIAQLKGMAEIVTESVNRRPLLAA